MTTSEALGRAGLGVPSLDNRSDGVAYVGRLLHRALGDLCAEAPRVLTMNQRSAAPVSPWAGASFAARLFLHQATGATDWWLFNHLGVARAQTLVPAWARRPYGIFLHGIEAWAPDLDPTRLRALQGASVLLANSEYTATTVQAAHPDVGVVHACPLGLLPAGSGGDAPDTDLLDRVRPASVLVVGRMNRGERRKGHDVLFESWPGVLREVPEAQLVVVGSGTDRPRLESRAEDLGIRASVLFTGFVGDPTLEALRKRVALFAMPSRGEGFGLVYLEAMRAGLPCIASGVEGARDVVEHERTGFLVDPADRSAVTRYITLLLSDGELRKRMGAAGADRFGTLFTYEAFRSRLAQLLPVSTVAV